MIFFQIIRRVSYINHVSFTLIPSGRSALHIIPRNLEFPNIESEIFYAFFSSNLYHEVTDQLGTIMMEGKFHPVTQKAGGYRTVRRRCSSTVCLGRFDGVDIFQSNNLGRFDGPFTLHNYSYTIYHYSDSTCLKFFIVQ